MNEGEGFSRVVTLETLGLFRPLLRTTDEANSEGTGTTSDGEAGAGLASDPELAIAESLFSGNRLKVPNDFERPGRTGGPSPKKGARVDPAVNLVSARGLLVWRKSLSASDVQRQRGNATGGVRLAQARFRDPDTGLVIDQTAYFRNKVFGAQKWSAGGKHPVREDCQVKMRVLIEGTDFGARSMRVTHKPSGEAGQGNYTSMLHWGDLGDEVKKRDLRGKRLSLYAPQVGVGPFYLEIT
jgi:hypothetical protein